MILIECFDKMPIRNMVACLKLQPEKLVFLGEEEQMKSQLTRYRKLLAQRGMKTEISCCPVPMDNVERIAQILEDLVTGEEECIVDVTGGEERLLVTVGMVLARLAAKGRHLTVQKFDLPTGRFLDSDGDGEVVPGRSVSLTIEEIIGLHGGIIYPQLTEPEAKYGPKDLQQLWRESCQDAKNWNNSISYMNEFEKRSESKTYIQLDLDELAGEISNFAKKEAAVWDFLELLERCGVINNRSTSRQLRYEYMNPMLQECVKKAGNLLEIKTLLEARSIRKDGAPYFHDCQVGVHIDWDGQIYDQNAWTAETRNEIDVLVTRGITPLFISCKNGDIGDDELYKLNTVAARFGGPHAKKMLVATDLERKGEKSLIAYAQRAADMGIRLVENAANLTSEQWEEELIAAMEGKVKKDR